MTRLIFKKIAVLSISGALFFGGIFYIARANGEVTVASEGVVPSDNSVVITGHVDPTFLHLLQANQDGIMVVVGEDANNLTIQGHGLVAGGGITAGGNFTDTILDLTQGTTYYFNVYQMSGLSPLLMSTQSFTTTGAVLNQVRVTVESTEPTKNSVTIQFNVDTTGADIGLKIKYGPDATNLSESTTELWHGSTTSGQAVSVPPYTINGLQSGTDYYYDIIDSESGVVYTTGHLTTLNSDGTAVSGSHFSPTYNDCQAGPNEYCLIEPLPGIKKVDPTKQDAFGDYINKLFNFAIGLGAVLAVVMIVIGGIQYMGTESVFGKGEDRDRIKNAILGLLILLGSFIILKTINSDLLKIGTSPQNLAVQVSGQTVAMWDDFFTTNPNGKACEAIYDTAMRSINTPTADAPGTEGGNAACSFVVDTIIEQAMGTTASGSCTTPELKTTALWQQLIASPKFKNVASVTLSLDDTPTPSFFPSTEFQGLSTTTAKIAKVGQLAKEGDIIISPSTPTIHGHVGICNDGCTGIISNSSSEHKVLQNFTFTSWVNDSNFKRLPLYIYRAKDCNY